MLSVYKAMNLAMANMNRAMDTETAPAELFTMITSNLRRYTESVCTKSLFTKKEKF